MLMAVVTAMSSVSCVAPYAPQEVQNRQLAGTLIGAAAGAAIGSAVTAPTNFGYGYRAGPILPGYNFDPHFGMGNQIRRANRAALYYQNRGFGY